jgi:transposase-like protein
LSTNGEKWFVLILAPSEKNPPPKRKRTFTKHLYTRDQLREALFAACEGMTVAAAARKYGVPPGTLYNTLSRARKRKGANDETETLSNSEGETVVE